MIWSSCEGRLCLNGNLDELIKELDLELDVHETNSELMKFDVGHKRDGDRRRPNSNEARGLEN